MAPSRRARGAAVPARLSGSSGNATATGVVEAGLLPTMATETLSQSSTADKEKSNRRRPDSCQPTLGKHGAQRMPPNGLDAESGQSAEVPVIFDYGSDDADLLTTSPLPSFQRADEQMRGRMPSFGPDDPCQAYVPADAMRNSIGEREQGDIVSIVVQTLCTALGVADLAGLRSFLSSGNSAETPPRFPLEDETEPEYTKREGGCLLRSGASESIGQPAKSLQRIHMQSAVPMLAAVPHSTVKSKWVEPEHIEKLSAQTDDFDWWFYQMHMHLNDCGISEPLDRLHFTRRHCEPSF